MSFGISNSVMSRVVQVCTPELFHQATSSSVVKDVCSQIADALESKRRGEMNNEDFETLKTQLKKRLPILTPHATFRNGRRCNSDAIPAAFPSMISTISRILVDIGKRRRSCFQRRGWRL